jgi:hypothetical protein
MSRAKRRDKKNTGMDEPARITADNSAGTATSAGPGTGAGATASTGTSTEGTSEGADADSLLPPEPESCFQRWREVVLWRIKGGHTKLLPHQCDALAAIEAYFGPGRESTSAPAELTRKLEPCVICMETDRTAVTALVPYVLGARRVLLLCPRLETTLQLADYMSDEQPLNRKLVVQLDVLPLEYVRRLGSLPHVRTCRQVHAGTFTDDPGFHTLVVVSAHTSSRKLPWHGLDTDLFDVVVVDDAHLFPVSFWKGAGRHFMGKVVFLTATPCAHLGKPAYHFAGIRTARQGGDANCDGAATPAETCT